MIYLSNLRLWSRGFPAIWRHRRRLGLSWGWYAKYTAYWLLDVGPNALTGGDPRESLSSRWFKDRRDYFLARLAYRFLEWLDAGHGRRAVNLLYGEGTDDNRELSTPWQFVLTVFWLLVLGGLVVWMS